MAKINDQYDIGAAFEAVENELIASMIRNMKRHKQEETDEDKQWFMWQAEQLKSLEKYKKENRKKYGKQFKDINDKIEELIRISRDEGEMQQEIQILNAIKKGFPAKRISRGGTVEFFKLNDRKLEALIKATTDDMQKAETAVLRMANDQYRKVIYNAQVYANTGAGTYEKAVDMATKDFLSAGLNCIEYANGARHTIADYADMAIRTACKRAYLQGEGQKRQEWGISTVIVNKRGNPCPLCLPFVGKVLIDDVWSNGPKDGKSPETGIKYPLMSKAVEAGLYHPRCRDSHTTYFEGISTPPDDKYTKEELDELVEKNREEVRQQYAERQEKKFGRLARYSLDQENQKAYQRKKHQWNNMIKSYRYPVNEEMFETFVRPRNDGKNVDVVKPRNIIKKLKSTEAGRIAYEHMYQNDILVQLLYNVDNPFGLSGEYDPIDKLIRVYVDTTKTIDETVRTVIHEATHDRLGHTGTRKEEVRCFIEEAKYDGIKLTPRVIKGIIKSVNGSDIYESLPWR